MAVGLALLGSVTPSERALLHGMLAVGLYGLARVGVPSRAARLAVASTPLAAAMAAGRVPLPRALLASCAPGIVEARPEDAWWTLALHPHHVDEALASWALLVGVAVAAVSVRVTRRGLVQTLAWATVAWAVVGAVHAGLGADRLLGVLPVRVGDGRFFAPLVDPNHHGLVLLAGLPFVVIRARATDRPERAAILWLTAAWAIAFPAVVASGGLLVALAAMAVVALFAAPWSWGRKLALLVAGGAAGAVAVEVLLRQQPEWWALSGQPRGQQWLDTLAMLRAHPLAGVGAGGYREAFVAFRTLPTFAVFEHAHSDVLEWVAETGALGVVAVGASPWLAPRPTQAALSPSRLPWTLSLVAMIVHGCVDFPWALPGVAALGVVIATVGAYGDDEPSPEVRRTGWVMGLAALQLMACGLWLHRAWVEDAVETVRAGDAEPELLEALEAWAPWRPEAEVARLQRTPDPEALTRAAARFVDDGLTLGRLASVAWRAGDVGQAEALLARAVLREPNDYRLWQLLAEVRAAGDDGLSTAEAWAEALRHWPRDRLASGEPFERAYATLPVGLWWLMALEDAPAHWSVRLAWQMLDEEDYATALMACEQAGALRPAAHARMGACAEALVGLGREDQAAAYVLDWIEEVPDDYWARVTAVGVLRRVGRDDEAWGHVAPAWWLRPDLGRSCRLLREARGACLRCPDEGCAVPPASTCALAAWALVDGAAEGFEVPRGATLPAKTICRDPEGSASGQP